MLSNKKILVVDDSQMNRLIAAATLSLKNTGPLFWKPLMVWRLLRHWRFFDVDLAHLDIEMPVMMGTEAVQPSGIAVNVAAGNMLTATQ
jgi:CheY-like chemotaxis protein